MKKLFLILLSGVFMTACVSKKKYVELEETNGQIKSQLNKERVENDKLKSEFEVIQNRVDRYNKKINSLSSSNDAKMVSVDGVVISENQKKTMRETLKHIPSEVLSNARSLKDSMNLAIQYNLRNSVKSIQDDDDINVNIDETVVMISISDKMMFRSGSYKVSSDANKILKKIADIVNTEQSLDLMVEGHTDNQKFKKSSLITSNWDLSVLRATSVVKRLQNEFGVQPDKLIASGRSSYQPLVENNSSENRAKNRRTRIVILPNIDKFFALMASSE